jgi:hypothetical protein
MALVTGTFASQPSCAILLPPRPACTDRGWLLVLLRRRNSIVSVPLDITARVRTKTLQVSSRAEEAALCFRDNTCAKAMAQ